MSFSPTKSFCRTGVGRSCVAVQNQQRIRQRYLNQLKVRRRTFSESVAAQKSRNVNPRFYSKSTVHHMNSQRSWPSTRILNRNRSSVASIATESYRSKDDKSIMAIATMAAAALLLGGTFQLEHQRILQDRENEIDTKVDLSTSAGKRSEIEILTRDYPDLLEYFWEGIQSSSSDGRVSQMEPLRRQAVKNPISAQFHQPRNVMISRMRSIKGRGLNEKYNVDWNLVLGEGAYGSVHPARLALTGEKVALKKISKRYTNSSDFFKETDALLRIYDNGGHPNISGLRDMVSLVTVQRLLGDVHFYFCKTSHTISDTTACNS